MKRKNHLNLGKKLSLQYFDKTSKYGRSAFLLGCMQPDWNLATYIKGSRTYELMRGHNYRNASRCMERLATYLESSHKWGLLSYYRLGKLIHYITDAFTQAHNNWFEGNLSTHCDYEKRLQQYFLSRLERPWQPRRELLAYAENIAELIHRTHLRYESHGGDCVTDARFVFAVTSEVFARLFAGAEAKAS